MDNADYRTIQFRGSYAANATYPLFVTFIRYERRNPNSLEIKLIWVADDEKERYAAGSVLRFKNSLWLHPTEPGHQAVEILGITSASYNVHEANIVATALNVGITDASLTEATEFFVTVNLQPSGILALPGTSELGFTGEIKKKPFKRGVISVATPFGRLVAEEAFEYSGGTQHGDLVTSQIQRARLGGTICLPANASLVAVQEALEKEVGDVCIVLSLCYRQTVSFYDVEYRQLGTSPARLALHRRRRPIRTRMERAEELIHSTALTGGGLNKLIGRLRSLTPSDAVRRSIDFLAWSYESDLEIAYFLAFSALEAATGACCASAGGRVETIPNTIWRPIEQQLRGTLDRAHGKLRKPTRERLALAFVDASKRLPGLRNAPLFDRITSACEQMGVDTKSIWPRDIGFAEGFRRAAKTRNDLFHAARDLASGPGYGDLVRIQVLTERLIVSLLRWPQKNLWAWHWERLDRINA